MGMSGSAGLRIRREKGIMAVRLVMGDIDIRYLEQMQGFLEKNFSSEV